MQLKLIKKNVIQKAAAATSDLIVNRIANRFTKVSRSSPQTDSEKVTNEHDNDDDELLYGMVERRKAISFISSYDHCQRSSPSQVTTRREQNKILDKEIPKEQCISPEEREKIIDDLGLI